MASPFDYAFGAFNGMPQGILPPDYGMPQGNFVGGRSVIGDILERVRAGATRGMGAGDFGGNYGFAPSFNYQPQQMPQSPTDLVLQGTGNQGLPPSLPPPINVPQMKVAEAQAPDQSAIPPAAQQIAFAAPQAQQMQAQPSRSFGDYLRTAAAILDPSQRPEYKQTGTDLAGNPTYGFVNPVFQTVNGQPIGGTTGPGTAYPRGFDGQPLQGQDLVNYLKKSDPATASYIEAIRRGDASVTGRNLQKYLPLATLAYPDLQQYNYDARKKIATDFAAGGKSANNIKSLDTVGGHAGQMVDLFDKLGNTWSPEFNSLKNFLSVRGGKGAVTAFETNATGVANELGAVFRSVGMSDYEIKSWRDKIVASASPQQFEANMRTLLDMLKTRRDVLIEQHAPIGDLPPGTFKRMNDAIDKIEKRFGAGGQAQTQSPSTPGVTSTGIKWSAQ